MESNHFVCTYPSGLETRRSALSYACIFFTVVWELPHLPSMSWPRLADSSLTIMFGHSQALHLRLALVYLPTFTITSQQRHLLHCVLAVLGAFETPTLTFSG